jgi:hypothetical protein
VLVAQPVEFVSGDPGLDMGFNKIKEIRSHTTSTAHGILFSRGFDGEFHGDSETATLRRPEPDSGNWAGSYKHLVNKETHGIKRAFFYQSKPHTYRHLRLGAWDLATNPFLSNEERLA